MIKGNEVDAAIQRYDEAYTNRRKLGATMLDAHSDALWWAIEEHFFDELRLTSTCNAIRDMAIERRKQAGDWDS